MTCKIDKEEKIAMILCAAPAAYDSVLTVKTRLKGTACTTDDLETVMKQSWHQSNDGKELNGQESGTDMALVVVAGVSGKTIASIECYFCHMKGHRANDCPK